MPAHSRGSFHKNTAILCATIAVCVIAPPAAQSAETVSPALLSEVVAAQAGSLAIIDSNAAAKALFTAKTGPSLGLWDAAKTLSAKGISEQWAKELGLAELSQTVSHLMGALAAWQLAESISRNSAGNQSPAPDSVALPPLTRQDWMKDSSRVAALADLFQALEQRQAFFAEAGPVSQPRYTELLLTANRVALEASQRATIAWWEIYRWKDRVRQARGQFRLCGTWQWTIHNHQNHREQKTVLLFPPPGLVPANALLPAETVVLGDTIYLRWEQGGHVQEDSLLFLKEGTRIEGSFVNNSGGWGSITGKRTADCQP
jgi:hypothetical protein